MPPKTQVADKVTFGTDDKRAQYARLVVFNFGVKEKIIDGKKRDVNSATNAELEKAAKSLAGGNLLDGKDGITLIQNLSKNGATDENVAKRGLTLAYAQEVRPYIRKKLLSDSFGRRGKKAAKDNGGETAPKAQKATGRGRGKRGAAAAAPTPEPTPEATEE